MSSNDQETLVLLPAHDFQQIRLVAVPADFSERDAVRHLTALIATVQQENPDWSWEQLAQTLEDHGIHPVDFILGPELNRP